MAKEKQKSLFGEVDQLFNCLHTELTLLNEDIEGTEKSIGRKEKQLGILQERKEKMEEAIATVKKERDELKKTEKKGY
jgi:chromosome segregation ATPase